MSKFSDWKDRLTRQFEAGKAKVELRTALPTYQADDSMPVEEARQKLDRHIDEFIREAVAWDAEQVRDDELNPFEAYAEREGGGLVETPPPPVQGACIATGVGKTQGFAARLARYIREFSAADDTEPMAWLYLVPTHRLGDDIADQFRAHGLTAKVYRGRNADDPNIPTNMERPKDERVKMCLDLEKVKLATQCGQDITKSCCKNKEQQCEFYNECGYQHQLRGEPPDVWIAAHNMLFHPQKKFGEIAGVVIDESFFKKGVSGIESHRGDLTLDDLAVDDCPWRKELIQILQVHPLGGLERARFHKINPELCKLFIGLEWNIVDAVKLSPQMTPAQLAEVRKKMPAGRRARRMVGIWGALRELLYKPEIAVSGRLVLDKNKAGQTVLRLRSVRPIVKSWKVPTFIMDATLPDILILRAFHPQVDVVANIEVEMPHVHIRQVVGAPVSKLKLWGTEKKPAVGEHNLKAIRRYVLQRWLETERRPMLVICQMDAEEWLKQAGLPDGIKVEHFNNISGLDRYKNVSSLILIGRTIPSPTVVEAYAGALTGAEPIKAAETGNWYGRVTRGIRLAAGGGIGVESDEHPDPVGEAVLWQICEAELMQALGRARGVNRTAETPLDVDILADVVLPVTINEIVPWTEPSAAVEMGVEGIALTNAKDMAKAWPRVWPNADAAKYMLKKLRALLAGRRGNRSNIPIGRYLYIGRLPSLGLYRTASNKTRPVAAFFDPRLLPNPRPWLEKRLGALASLFHLVRNGEIASLGAKVGLTVDNRLVTVLTPAPREMLDQLFDRAARKPWRLLPEQPSASSVCDGGERRPSLCPSARHNFMRCRTVNEREAERRKAA
jgi:hypothetical protein